MIGFMDVIHVDEKPAIRKSGTPEKWDEFGSVSENRRKQLSVCTLRVAIAYTEGDNGRVLRR